MDTNKLIVYIAILAGLIGGFFMYGAYTAAKSAKEIQSQWDEEKALYAGRVLQQEMQNKVDQERLKEELANQKQELQNENVAIAGELDRAIKRSLRIPATTCPTYSLASDTEGTQGDNETVATSVALPETITSDLRRLMAEADGVTAQARAAQVFIKNNGLGETDEANK